MGIHTNDPQGYKPCAVPTELSSLFIGGHPYLAISLLGGGAGRGDAN